MTTRGFALFDTAIGACGIAWGERGLVGVQLPEASAARTAGAHAAALSGHARGRRRRPTCSARSKASSRLLRGEAIDLSAVALDMDGVPPFHRRVYELARTIPRGRYALVR